MDSSGLFLTCNGRSNNNTMYKENEIEEKLDLEKMKLENNEDQAAERIRVAEEKLEIARAKNRGGKK